MLKMRLPLLLHNWEEGAMYDNLDVTWESVQYLDFIS